MSKLRHRRLALAALLATAACSNPETKAAAATAPERAALVEVEVLKKGSIRDRWRFLGDVRAVSRSGLASGASGTVTRVMAREGDRVAKGKLVVEVDPALAAARVEVARAAVLSAKEQLAQANREFARLQALKKGVVAAVELERARSRVQQLESDHTGAVAREKEARAELRLHRVRAPFDGVVTRRTVDPGDWVRPGDPVLELVSTGRVEVLVDAARELFQKVSPGDTVSILASPPIEGEVVGIVPALSPVSRTMRVRVAPKSDPDRLLPGGAVEVAFDVDLSADGFVVAQDALLVGPTNTRIMRVVEGKAAAIEVEVLAKADGRALIRGEGLAVGDEIVVRGNERLRPGQSVQGSSK